MVMLLFLLVSLAVLGGGVYSVLDRPMARDKRRNHLISAILLALSALAGTVTLIYTLTAWLSD